MKKLLTLLLVAAMVLGMVGSAFAATTTPSTVAGPSFSDIAGNDAEANITLLAVKGILKGDAGATTVRPEATITRAEFATMVIRMLNKDTLATSLASMKPVTKDEIPTWAWGYVNLAQSMGIMTGDPSGAFRPTDNVTFAEALKMLEVAIGWDKTAVGVWPMNYMVVAYDKGLTDGVDAFANTPATRGEVAIMMVNTMNTQKYVGTAEDGTINKGAAILNSDPDWTVNTYEGVVTAINPDSNDISIYDDTTHKLTLAASVSLAGATAFDDLLNVNVKAVVVSSKVAYIEVTDDADVITGTLDEFTTNDDGYQVITVDDKDYVLAPALDDDDEVVLADDPTTVFYLNGTKIDGVAHDFAAITVGDPDVDPVVDPLIQADDTVVLNLVDDQVVTVNATRETYTNALVGTVKLHTGSTTKYDLTISGVDDTLSVASTTPVTIDGASKSVKDLAKNDVVYVTTGFDKDGVATTTVQKIVAFRATVKGDVVAVKTTSAGKVTVTLRLADDTTKSYVLSSVSTPSIGATVEYRLNRDGKARYALNVNSSTDLVLITDAYTNDPGTGDRYYVVFDVNGASKTVEVDDVDTYGTAVVGSFCTYDVTSGKVSTITVRTLDAVSDLTEAEVISVDSANGVAVVNWATTAAGVDGILGNADDVVTQHYDTLGINGLAVYEYSTEDEEYVFAGVSALSVGDKVWADTTNHDLIITNFDDVVFE